MKRFQNLLSISTCGATERGQLLADMEAASAATAAQLEKEAARAEALAAELQASQALTAEARATQQLTDQRLKAGIWGCVKCHPVTWRADLCWSSTSPATSFTTFADPSFLNEVTPFACDKGES